jgi:hypothetical protein
MHLLPQRPAPPPPLQPRCCRRPALHCRQEPTAAAPLAPAAAPAGAAGKQDQQHCHCAYSNMQAWWHKLHPCAQQVCKQQSLLCCCIGGGRCMKLHGQCCSRNSCHLYVHVWLVPGPKRWSASKSSNCQRPAAALLTSQGVPRTLCSGKLMWRSCRVAGASAGALSSSP